MHTPVANPALMDFPLLNNAKRLGIFNFHIWLMGGEILFTPNLTFLRARIEHCHACARYKTMEIFSIAELAVSDALWHCKTAVKEDLGYNYLKLYV